MPEPLVICDNLVKIYKVADLEVVAQAQRIRYERFTVGHVWQQSGRNLLTELNIQDGPIVE